MFAPPRRSGLGGIEPSVCRPREAVVPERICVVQDTVRDPAVGLYQFCHAIRRFYGSSCNIRSRHRSKPAMRSLVTLVVAILALSPSATTLPNDDAAIVHVLSRTGFGPRPGD